LHFRLPALFLALKTLALFLMLVAGKSALDSGNLFLAVEPSACRDIFLYRDRSPHERKDGFANHFATLGIALDPPPILVDRVGDRGSKPQIVAYFARRPCHFVKEVRQQVSCHFVNNAPSWGCSRRGSVSPIRLKPHDARAHARAYI
jgi:hypothetical protein